MLIAVDSGQTFPDLFLILEIHLLDLFVPLACESGGVYLLLVLAFIKFSFDFFDDFFGNLLTQKIIFFFEQGMLFFQIIVFFFDRDIFSDELLDQLIMVIAFAGWSLPFAHTNPVLDSCNFNYYAEYTNKTSY